MNPPYDEAGKDCLLMTSNDSNVILLPFIILLLEVNLMSITVTLDHQLTHALAEKAQQLHLQPEEVVIQAIREFMQGDTKNGASVHSAELKQLVADIEAIPPNPAMITPAQGTIAETMAMLALLPKETDFDLAEWTQKWAEIETEMKMTTRANAFAEGRI
jgi:predicted transcriptional regulator